MRLHQPKATLVSARRAMIEPEHSAISIRRQCDLFDLSRASCYYTPATESALNLELMRQIDEQYLRTLLYGWTRMTAHLQRLGYAENHKRVRRLLRLMGLEFYNHERLHQSLAYRTPAEVH